MLVIENRDEQGFTLLIVTSAHKCGVTRTAPLQQDPAAARDSCWVLHKRGDGQPSASVKRKGLLQVPVKRPADAPARGDVEAAGESKKARTGSSSIAQTTKQKLFPFPKNSTNVLSSYIENKQRKNGDLGIAYLLLSCNIAESLKP